MTTSYNSQSLLIYYILLSFLPCITPATSIGNPDLERYFRTSNTTQTFASEERITMDVYTYAFLNYSFMDNHEMHLINYPEEKARYGEGKILSVHGQLVHISDVNDPRNDTACSGNILGTKGRPTPQQGITWIALVRRGHCTFEEKVRNVHLKGAAGVIIYNDKPVINLEKMQIKGKTRNITAVITYQDIGLAMAMRLDDDVEVMAHIIEGRSGMRPISSFNRTSVLFVAISFIILMLISLIWLIVYYIQRFRNLHTKDQQSRHLCSVTQKVIMKIPTKTGKTSDEKDADSDCCAICIEAYKISDLIRVLPCKHEFHKNCIDPWLIEHRTCPMCKLDVLKFYGYVVGDELQTIPTATAPLPTIAIDEPDVPVVVVGVLPTQTTVSSLNQYHQYSHHRNPHPSNTQQQQHQQQQQLQMNGNECGSISSSSNSYDSSTTTNPPQQCALATQQCCNNVEGRAQPTELAANNSSCSGGVGVGSGVSGSSSNNNGHQSCASISNNSCPIHTVAHMPPAQCNRSNLLNGHHQKNDLCSWHISVPGLNLTINSNQPFVVESPTNDNALNDARSSQFCTSSRQVTDV